jgi:hypothetical protein
MFLIVLIPAILGQVSIEMFVFQVFYLQVSYCIARQCVTFVAGRSFISSLRAPIDVLHRMTDSSLLFTFSFVFSRKVIASLGSEKENMVELVEIP